MLVEVVLVTANSRIAVSGAHSATNRGTLVNPTINRLELPWIRFGIA